MITIDEQQIAVMSMLLHIEEISSIDTEVAHHSQKHSLAYKAEAAKHHGESKGSYNVFCGEKVGGNGARDQRDSFLNLVP